MVGKHTGLGVDWNAIANIGTNIGGKVVDIFATRYAVPQVQPGQIYQNQQGYTAWGNTLPNFNASGNSGLLLLGGGALLLMMFMNRR